MLRPAAAVHGLDELLHGLVAERGQVLGGLLTQGSDLRRRDQREHVLHIGHTLRPELLPEHIVASVYWLE